MRKIFLLVTFSFISILSFAEPIGCYWVFFSDKANTSFNPYEYFDSKAIERRERLGLPLDDISDYPLNNEYVNAVAELSEEMVGETRWFNGVGIMASEENIEIIKRFSFVKSVVEIYRGEMIQAGVEGFDNDSEFDANALKPTLFPQLSRMQGEKFAEANIDGKGIRIAVFDGGFPQVDKHEFFQHLRDNNQIIKTWNFPNKKDFVYGWSSHGTMTLSCIAGICNSQKMGLATGADFLLARTEVNPEPFKEEIWWMQAMEWADQNGADIISSSLGYGKERYYTYDMDGTSYVAKAANLAAKKGMLVFNSMGNEGDDPSWKVLITPADADSVVSVGGIEDGDSYRRIGFTSYGPTSDGRRKPNVCAYGHAVVANPKGGATMAYGTSFSCPLVAGFAACALQTNKELSPMQLKEEIEKSGDLYPYFDYALGYGVPQAGYFMHEQKEEPTPTVLFERKANTLEITFLIYEDNPEVFCNIQAPDGKLVSYHHFDIKLDPKVIFYELNKYAGCTVNIYYHGYVGSYYIEGNDNDKVANMPKVARVEMRGVRPLLEKNVMITETLYDKPKKCHFLVQVSAGFVGFRTYEGNTNKTKTSYSALLGMTVDAGKVYKLGFGVGMGCDDYWGTGFVNPIQPLVPVTANITRERFRTSNLNAEIFQRVRITTGGIFSNGLLWDLGVFGMWNFENRDVIKFDNVGAETIKSRMVCKNFNFVNDWQWGVKTAITYDIVSVYAKLRISNLLNSEYTGSYNDLMKFELGMQLVFPMR